MSQPNASTILTGGLVAGFVSPVACLVSIPAGILLGILAIALLVAGNAARTREEERARRNDLALVDRADIRELQSRLKSLDEHVASTNLSTAERLDVMDRRLTEHNNLLRSNRVR